MSREVEPTERINIHPIRDPGIVNGGENHKNNRRTSPELM